MRATITPAKRRTRGIASAMARHGARCALSILGSGTALAANPNWIVGHGTDSAPRHRSLRPAPRRRRFGAGRQVGFFEWLRNGDTSNISQLYLTASTDAERDRGRRDLDDQDRGGRNGPHRRVPGRDAADLRVRRAELRQHGLPRRRIHDAVDPRRRQPPRRVHFEFNTTGTPGGKNNSHGDAKAID